MKQRLLTPGPTPIPEEVRLTLSKEMIHHRKSHFRSILIEVEEHLKMLFGTREEVLILSCSGTGGMEAALANLFCPMEEVIVVEGGKFGKRWREMAHRIGLRPYSIEVRWGEAVKIEEIEEALEKYPHASGILIQASETSTGVLHPIREIGELVKDRDLLLVVDGISAVGISPCPMEEWNIDCLISGSQKGLMVPPGLAFVAFSKKAWKKAEGIRPSYFYFDLKEERKRIREGQTLFTSSVTLIRALHTSLKNFFSSSLDERYTHQWALTCMTRTGITALGLDLFAPHNYTWGLTSIHVPGGKKAREILSYCEENFHIYLAGGQDKLKGKIIRIGHMGDVDMGDISVALWALYSALDNIIPGFKPKQSDFLERALYAHAQALSKGYPKEML